MAKRDINTTDLERKYPSNNLESSNLPTKPEPVELEGVVTQTRRSGFAKDVNDIAMYLYSDVVLPALKSALTDLVNNGIEMLVWGKESNRGSYRRGVTRRTNYNARSRQIAPRRTHVRTQRDQFEMDDIVFSNRSDADRTRAQLLEYIAQYGVCSVGDLYSVIGWTSTNVHQQWGWYNLNGMAVRATADGYHLELPTPEPLRR